MTPSVYVGLHQQEASEVTDLTLTDVFLPQIIGTYFPYKCSMSGSLAEINKKEITIYSQHPTDTERRNAGW